jgi:hypothetical protein
MVAALGMRLHGSAAGTSDGRLWATALATSLLANVLVVAAFGIAAVKIAETREARPPAPRPQASERLVLIVPELVPPELPPEPEAAPDPPDRRFARTSDEQRAPRPDTAAFIGERDTRATSDAPPDANAPPLPSQAGEPPRHENDLETTQGQFQEGPDAPPAPPPQEAMAETRPPVPEPPPPSPPAEPASRGEANERPELAETMTDVTPEPIAAAPNPVDVPVRREPEPEQETTATDDPQRPPDGLPEMPEQTELAETPAEPEAAPPPTIRDPAFRSEQRKAAISGSISRTGTSALDVADTPLGRYQSAISKAVEQEWRRNCVRHRDFITPGFLTVRFYVQADGKVRNVAFVGVMETGEIQKGFTLNSIREAPIPPMPDAVRAELDGEPLELTFNFYF